MNTFTAQGLSDFYQKVADGGEIQNFFTTKSWDSSTDGPSITSSSCLWRIKPTKKVIDLSVLIDGIDCEFDDLGNTSAIAKLETITTSRVDEAFVYISDKGLYWNRCRPRMNHKHAWPEGECPLPEGFEVKVWFRSGGHTVVTTRSGNYWGINGDTMCFEVLRVADGYVMPWEQDND
jgi:hypothetical protein|tara:strand:- start:2401 stop:2931 length:531 start_codon:yes stop_codon:yes gene_type:complete